MHKVSRPYVLLSAAVLLYSLRLFVVGGEHITMAMVVMVGHICTQNVMVVHNSYWRINSFIA